ncbi:MAG: hypothetical protein KAT75_06910, partial [Dehalococcoidia bacterium]|nr:hypothetical protein [Dehalococcoidia bacterium]
GEDPNGFGNSSLVDYLKENADFSSEFNIGTALAKNVLAAVAACGDPTAFGSGEATYAPDGDYLAALKDLHNGTQFTDGFGSTDTLNDDIWGLMAVVAAGEPLDSAIVTSTVAFIEANQGFDGGWSWATSDNLWYYGSDCDDTAAALMALTAAGGASAPAIVDNAVTYMQFCQGPTGGFQYDAWGAENLASTAWTIDAIVAIGQDPTGPDWTTGGNPVDFLMTYQQPDGSFLDSAAWSPNPYRNTADAIIALTGNPYPVISILPVSIDIKPGTFPNDINLKSRGRIPVAILTTGCFDAATVDASTVRFGPAGAAAVHDALKDVDGDGNVDMILHFKTEDTGIKAGDTEATLTGETLDGGKIVGTDSVS